MQQHGVDVKRYTGCQVLFADGQERIGAKTKNCSMNLPVPPRPPPRTIGKKLSGRLHLFVGRPGAGTETRRERRCGRRRTRRRTGIAPRGGACSPLHSPPFLSPHLLSPALPSLPSPLPPYLPASPLPPPPSPSLPPPPSVETYIRT